METLLASGKFDSLVRERHAAIEQFSRPTASNVDIQIHSADNISSLFDQEKRDRRLANTQRPIDEVLNVPKIGMTREDLPDDYFEYFAIE